jgi:hypothetical protein
MAGDWYGYGRWDAPYWFIGPEPGQEDKGRDDLEKRRAAWEKLGGGEILDCREHHLALGILEWHCARARIQPTWGKLIRLLLASKGLSPTKEEIRAYQRTRWGMSNGETCVVELSALAANNLGVEREREQFLNKRVEFLGQKIRKKEPKFVVMYGNSRKQAPSREKLAGGPFESDGIRIEGATVLMHVPHPVAFGSKNAEWNNFGELMRKYCARIRSKKPRR